MDDFHHRQLLPGESLPVFIHELKRRYARSRRRYIAKTVSSPVSIEISKQLWAAGETEDLDKLVQCARLLMTLTKKEKSATIGQQRPNN